MAKQNKVKEGEEVQKSELQKTLDRLNSLYGAGTVISADTKPMILDTVDTGSIGLNIALGIGGAPRGRIMEVVGPESCLDKDTYIAYEVWSEDGDRLNHKGGSILRLYERFHSVDVGGSKIGRSNQSKKQVNYYVKSVNHENCIIRNKVVDVVRTGTKQCYEMTTESGYSIICTEEHKFLTEDGYRKLNDLVVGSGVYIHNNTRHVGREKYITRHTKMVKYHPYLPTKVVEGKYLYYRGGKSRLVYEAWLNGLSIEEYIYILNNDTPERINKMLFIPTNMHVHHRDEDYTNDNIDNLQLISPSEHGVLHSSDRMKNLSYVAVVDKIKNIVPVGERETYDIKCLFPNNNYIANKFVVHNCGKTSICLHIVANAQKQGLKCAYIDMEHHLSGSYAKDLNVNLEELLLSQPSHGEQAMKIAEELIKTGEVGVVIVDSVAALVPKSEVESGVGDPKMAGIARIMSQGLRVINPLVEKHNVLMVFTNQIRSNPGGMVAEEPTGGKALRFYAGVRLDMRRIKNDRGEELSRTKIKVLKNKVGKPFSEIEVDMLWGIGFSRLGEIVDISEELGMIVLAGSWYKMPGKDGASIAQGRNAMIQVLKDNADMAVDWESQIIERLKEQ